MRACVCVGLLRIVGIYFCAFLSLWDAYVEGRCARAYVCVCLLRSSTSSCVDIPCRNLHSLYLLLFQAVSTPILYLLMLYLLFCIGSYLFFCAISGRASTYFVFVDVVFIILYRFLFIFFVCVLGDNPPHVPPPSRSYSSVDFSLLFNDIHPPPPAPSRPVPPRPPPRILCFATREKMVTQTPFCPYVNV